MLEPLMVTDALITPEQLKEALQVRLGAVERYGSFAAESDLGEINPGLFINGLGLISMPISQHDVPRNIKLASRTSPLGQRF